jgi:O-succinylbenzoate synthase
MPAEPPPVSITAASVHLVSVPMRRAYRFAGGELIGRILVLVRLAGEDCEGWGEAAPVPGYSADDAEGTFAMLADAIRSLPGTEMAHPRDAAGLLPATGLGSGHHALESAAWDLAARTAGMPLASLIGGSPGRLPVGAVLGLDPDPSATAAAAQALLEAGCARVKVKLDGPGDLPALAVIADSLPAGALAADANGSLPPALADALAERVAAIPLAYLEQPFPPGELDASAILNEAVPVCLDEAATDLAATRRALAAGAASLVAVKPGRLGGIGVALATLDVVRRAGAGALVGGLLESGIGRAVSRALATVPGFTHPPDLTPSIGYLAHDLVTGPSVLEPGGVLVPERPGWGGTVDGDAVTRCTIRSASAR